MNISLRRGEMIIMEGGSNAPVFQQYKPYQSSKYFYCHLHGCPCSYFGDPVKQCACSQSMIQKYLCQIDKDVKDLLKQAVTQLGLSARAYDRILKLSRTVADLDGEEKIGIAHVVEAIQYRALDRKLWG